MHKSLGGHWKKVTLTVLVLAVLSAALTGCGGSGLGATSASAGGGAVASEEGSSPQFRWELKFTGCLREAGIRVGDPDPVTGAPPVEHDAAYATASKACEERIGAPPAASAESGPGVEKARTAAELKMAGCLREHGVDVADPGPEEALAIPEGTDAKVLDECVSPNHK